jgi:CarboxypepD_reg-like domain
VASLREKLLSGPEISCYKKEHLETPMTNPTQPIALAVLLLVAAPLAAQTKDSVAPKTGMARIVGVALDSINGGYLTGATILLDPSQRSVDTDSAGRFSFDSVAPGTYRLGLFHPLLDALDVSIATQPFRAGADSASVVIMSVPSPATVVSSRCPHQKTQSAIIGHISDATTLATLAGAQVSIAWNEIEVSKSVGIRNTPHLLQVTTDRNGEYVFCGLPSSLQATLKAQRGSATTDDILVSLADRPIDVQARNLFLSSEDSTTKTGKAAVSGVVTLEGSPANAVSRVELQGTDIATLTNEKGEFTLANLPSGTRNILARRLGYVAQTVAVDLNPRNPQRVTVKLPKFVPVMDPVLVTARRTAALDKVGFNQRKKSAFGYFLDADRISKMHPFYVSDILRMVPGLRIRYDALGQPVVTSGRDLFNSCVAYFVDNLPFAEMTPGDINSFVNGGEVMAAEVYQPGTAPAEYVRNNGNCTTIVLWTRFKVRD